MTFPAGVSRCSPLRIADWPGRAWLSVHLVLYFALDLTTLATLSAMETTGTLHPMSKVLTGVVDAVASVAWVWPLHGVTLLLVAGGLALLRSVAALRWYWFRVAALAVFVVPALLLAFLLSSGDVAVSLAVLQMHILMGLLVVRPSSHWANATPSMNQHRW